MPAAKMIAKNTPESIINVRHQKKRPKELEHHILMLTHPRSSKKQRKAAALCKNSLQLTFPAQRHITLWLYSVLGIFLF
jgi:hypothetical protein